MAAGGRRPRAPATAVQSQRVPPLSLVWPAGLWRQKSGWRRFKSSVQKGQLDFCLQVKQVVEGGQKAFWKVAGLRRTLN